MGLSIRFTGASDGSDGPFSLATHRGWVEFCEWASTEPVLKRFCEDGQYAGTAALERALSTHMESVPPKDASTRSVAEHLLLLLGAGDADEVALVES
jgi:hypothetical protein